MQYYDQQLQTLNNKIKEMENSISFLQDSVLDLSMHLKETQSYLIKLSHNQSETADRVTMWPFVTMPNKSTVHEEKN